MRSRLAVAPRSRAASNDSTSVFALPSSMAGTTTSGLNTPKALTTASPGTRPMHADRLQK